MKKIALILAAAALALCVSCNKNDQPGQYDGMAHETYTETDAVFPNPERGFYFVNSYHSASDSPMNSKITQAQRSLNRTLVYMGYYPKEYMDGDIAPEFLELMRKNLQVLREGGVKCILRFAYSDSESERPWDPKPEIVQRHIQNIKPVLQEYGDVILVFQAGFVGVWGEWYYTENFVSNPNTPEKHALRKEVTDAMLAALPSDRQIALRTPMFARMMYADSYTDTLTVETAHNGTPRSRISAFNDCFGASSNDTGTFSGEQTREFWKADTRYVFMGGETCGLSQYCTCEASLKDMEDYHWTYLNSAYHGGVLTRWRTDGCMPEIERRLGYRLSLTDVYNDKAAVAGQDFRVVLNIKNSGFSAPINPRGVELVLVDGNGKKTVYEQKDVDPRYWFAGETVTLDRIIKIPADATGECTLYLNIPDPKPTLHDNPMFSIRLANENVWDEETGFNKVATFTL